MSRKMILLRVGIDSGSGGIQGPLFTDGSFEFVGIPDKKGVGVATYGNTIGSGGRLLLDYFPTSKRKRMENVAIHSDPEFETFTYGDPTPPKRSLRNLEPGDFLVFYCGLQRWHPEFGFSSNDAPALYLVGYFEVAMAGMANDFSQQVLKREFGNNYHVRHPSLLKLQKDNLVLVKGGQGSRILTKACLISELGEDRNRKPLKVLSEEMRRVFGDFGGKVCIQRSPPRKVEVSFMERAIEFLSGLP